MDSLAFDKQHSLCVARVGAGFYCYLPNGLMFAIMDLVERNERGDSKQQKQQQQQQRRTERIKCNWH